MALADSGDFKDAISALTELAHRFPTNPRSFLLVFRLSSCYCFGSLECYASVASMKKSTLGPGSALLLKARGADVRFPTSAAVLEGRRGNMAAARMLFQRAIACCPTDVIPIKVELLPSRLQNVRLNRKLLTWL